jgi:ADP-ribose pyrophosphatase
LIQAKNRCPTIKRELREEAGLVAKHWEQLGGEIHLSNCVSSERGLLYLARDLSEVECEPEGTEVLQVRKLPLREALQLVDDGIIVDGMSIIALLRAGRKLGL